jgi:hypothetical protein
MSLRNQMNPPTLMCLLVLLALLPVTVRGVPGPAELPAEQLQLCSSLQGLQTLAAGQTTADALSNATAAAAQLWIWGFPLLAMSKAAQPAIRLGAINKLFNAPTLVTPQNQAVFNIVAPNCDTLYSTSW